MEKLRVFIAVDVNDPITLSRIERFKEALSSTGTPMKLVESHNMHITLRFIGEVESGIVEEIKSHVLENLEFERFEIALRGVGGFPNIIKPRVVWVGVARGSERLAALRRTIDSRLSSLGFRPEAREFTPHLTIARVKGSRNITRLHKLLQESEDLEFGVSQVDSVKLKKSTLTPKGPIYDDLMEVKAVEM